MDKMILIKYGELTTKKANRNLFISHLYKDIKDKLKDYSINIIKDNSRMYIETNDDIENITNILTKVFGIHSIVIAYKVNTNTDIIKEKVLEVVKNINFKTFKVDTKRSYKEFPYTSMEFNNVIGGLILKNIPNISVDVHNPEYTLKLEIRNDYTYIYTKEIMGAGGYPNGVAGKGLLMLSGGIDSPVSGYLAMKRGIKLECIYFESPPHTSIQAKNKVKSLVKKLTNYQSEIKLYVVNFTKIQEEIYKNADPEYMITIMRRMMYRISEKIIKRNNLYVLINGESVGQVASQTLTSMNVINNVTNIPVLRPVCCMDKLEIIDIAKKIDTYETSILPYEDCCTIFLPKHPVINPTLDKCLLYETLFDYEELINEAVNNIEIIKINNNEDKFNL
ncbi:MAG: tRNA 4-thiouridine(8) synthase ThiI [Bacilli bacterium]|nr:tRNA 4-thiouridine(8) synthase ThiI [Bacilli bacterium]